MRLIEDDTYDIGLYKPDGVDPQTPHNRDEVYIVAAGTGEFVCDGKTKAFAPGDMLIVSAGVAHRFQNFSENFSTWVVFFGARS
jgi:mannose-6-phosphate isomerase-like protein (cupin superfamily)